MNDERTLFLAQEISVAQIDDYQTLPFPVCLQNVTPGMPDAQARHDALFKHTH